MSSVKRNSLNLLMMNPWGALVGEFGFFNLFGCAPFQCSIQECVSHLALFFQVKLSHELALVLVDTW